jgi:hypothetical protein
VNVLTAIEHANNLSGAVLFKEKQGNAARAVFEAVRICSSELLF